MEAKAHQNHGGFFITAQIWTELNFEPIDAEPNFGSSDQQKIDGEHRSPIPPDFRGKGGGIRHPPSKKREAGRMACEDFMRKHKRGAGEPTLIIIDI